MRTLLVLVLVVVALVAAPALFGCGGSGDFRAGVYQDSQGAYRLGELGPRWEPLEVTGENDLAFQQRALAAVVQVNASCSPALDIPLEALTQHLLIGFTEREEVEPPRRVPMDGREALRSHVRAKLDGVPRELLLYVLKKDGCVYDFALVAPPGAAFQQVLESYEAMISGFGTVSSGARR